MSEPRNSSAIDVDSRLLKVASRGKHAPRIPDTIERRRLERQRSIRQIVFGVQDGVLTSLGIATGIGSATSDRTTILVTGALSLLVGAISMGVGEHLGNKAEREVIENAIDFERLEMLEKPEDEFAEQLTYYRLKGFTDAEAQTIVERLAKNPDIWLHEMVRDEFGIDVRAAEPAGPAAAFGMGGSFALGHALPLLPYLFPIALVTAMWGCLAFAVATLFSIGVFAGRLGGRNPIVKGLEITSYGAAVFVISYLAGHFIPPLFGLHPVAVGG
ncbi:MAG: VIT1/CCC1 transporter family protein [Candidatus Eremiobacteraeota bacterium]|nr:VIT1/CCC1 transporter family protein [Candidatus Eremiobacteraeota bacterium]